MEPKLDVKKHHEEGQICHANLGESSLQNIRDTIETIKKEKSSIEQNHIIKIIDIYRLDVSLILGIYSTGRNSLE